MKGDQSKSRAKRIIVEIVRQGGPTFGGYTRLYKAFYFAHLYYFQENVGLLSDWPIVHMPKGPGIEAGRELIDELISAGQIIKETVYDGPFRSAQFRVVGNPKTDLDEKEIASIRGAVDLVKTRSATELSELLHDFSRAWIGAQSGQPLNIYIDLIEDGKYDDDMERMRTLRDEVAAVFRD